MADPSLYARRLSSTGRPRTPKTVSMWYATPTSALPAAASATPRGSATSTSAISTSTRVSPKRKLQGFLRRVRAAVLDEGEDAGRFRAISPCVPA